MLNLRIIVDGPFSSGKTTFIRAASEVEVYSIHVAINMQADYAAMDYGRIEIDSDSALVLLGTPGAKPFSLNWLIPQNFMVGYVITVDSAQPMTFREAKYRIAHFRANSIKQFVIAANKQDKPNSWSVDHLRTALDIPPEIPVVPCVATDKESVKRVLLTLLDEVLKAMAADKE